MSYRGIQAPRRVVFDEWPMEVVYIGEWCIVTTNGVRARSTAESSARRKAVCSVVTALEVAGWSLSAITRRGPYVSAYHCSTPRAPPWSGSAIWAKYGPARPSWLPCVQSAGTDANRSGEAV